jgi:hypothetical protein
MILSIMGELGNDISGHVREYNERLEKVSPLIGQLVFVDSYLHPGIGAYGILKGIEQDGIADMHFVISNYTEITKGQPNDCAEKKFDWKTTILTALPTTRN